jgi:S-adenosylmethionine synthetase
VGKIYNLLSHKLARRIYDEVAGVEEVYVWLCSQIGRTLDEPWAISAELTLRPDALLTDVEGPIAELVAAELAGMASFTERLCRGELPVC